MIGNIFAIKITREREREKKKENALTILNIVPIY